MSQNEHITLNITKFTHRVAEKWVPEMAIFTVGTVEG